MEFNMFLEKTTGEIDLNNSEKHVVKIFKPCGSIGRLIAKKNLKL